MVGMKDNFVFDHIRGVKLVGPYSQLLPKICFASSPYSLEDFTCFSALSYDITIVYRKYFPKTESTFLSLIQDKILLLGSKQHLAASL